jgi:uncharacterized protein YcfJ
MKKNIHLIIVCFLVLSFVPSVQATPLGGAVRGGLGGAVLGGLIGGRKGARTGAAIGGAVGLVRGVREEDRRRESELAYQRQAAERDRLQQQAAQQVPKTDTQVLEIQKSLVRIGLDPGEVNGQLTPATTQAISKYESDNGLLVTGRPSPELYKHMLQHGG